MVSLWRLEKFTPVIIERISEPMNNVPAKVLNASVEGLNLQPGTLRDQLDQQGTLLLFLRHFG